MNRQNLLLLFLGFIAVQASLASVLRDDVATLGKLTQLLVEGDYDKFVSTLKNGDLDINKADSSGRLLIVEAVKHSRISFIDFLLQRQVNVNQQDPVTGETALQIAFQKNSIPMARLLMSYGASPDIPDRLEKTARNFVPSNELGGLLGLYDREGPMAFEDAPGAWTRYEHTLEDGKVMPFYYNEANESKRWNLPPSCAWRRIVHDDTANGVSYANLVTKQQVDFIPPALAWTRVRRAGSTEPDFYNWRANISREAPPAELSEEDLAELMKAPVNRHWYSPTTKEYAWVNPDEVPRWKKFHHSESGRDFFLDTFTGETTWDVPVELAWEETSSEDGKPYFYNTVTGEAHWKVPKAWTLVDKVEL